MPLGVNDVALSIVLGTALGLGVCLVMSLAPRWGAPSLALRVAPYIRDVTDAPGLTAAPAHDVALLWQELARRLTRLGGGSEATERRLRQAGWAMDAAAFRARQLTWAVAGVALGGVAVVTLALLGRGAPSLGFVPPLLAAVAVVACDALLSRAARGRVDRIQEELPTVLEFLALCLS